MTASLPWTSSTTSSSGGRPPGQRCVRIRQPASLKGCSRGSSGPETPGAVTSTVGIDRKGTRTRPVFREAGAPKEGATLCGELVVGLDGVADAAPQDQQARELPFRERVRRTDGRAAAEPIRLID